MFIRNILNNVSTTSNKEEIIKLEHILFLRCVFYSCLK